MALGSFQTLSQSMVFSVLKYQCIIYVAVFAYDTNVQYVDDGAVLISPGSIRLNNPEPINIEIEDYEQCVGVFIACYKSSDSRTYAVDGCDRGYCPLHIDVESLRSIMATPHFTNKGVEFTVDEYLSGCKPDYDDGFHTYQVLKLPMQCTMKVKGATDPWATTTTRKTEQTESIDALENTSETTPTNNSTSDSVIWGIVGGIAVIFVLLVIISVVLYCLVIKPCLAKRAAKRRQQRNQPPGTAAPQPLASSAQKVAVKTASKTTIPSIEKTTSVSVTAKPQPVPPKPEPSVEPEEPDEPEPTPAMDPKPEKKKALTPEDYQLLVPYTESMLVSLARLEHIDRDILESVFEKWNTRLIHDVWKLEKIVLQARPDEAIDALNKLTAELDNGLLKNDAKYGSNTSTDAAWEYANFVGLPASYCHRLFAMSYPDVFKDIEGRLDDPVIANLSVPGLYCCLMNDGFDQDFKKKLIVEMRARAVNVLEYVHQDELFFSAFPMYYLANRYKFDKKNFVEGFVNPDVSKSTHKGL